MMSVRLVRATPQIRDPSSKMVMVARKTALMLKKVYSRPKMSCSAAVVSRYELPYQPTSLRLRNSSVMRGIAVAMIELSD